jgi:hypothetical protein
MLDWRPAQEVRALLQDAQTSLHASQGAPAAIFLDEPSEPVLATQPIAAHARARMMAQTTEDMPAYRAPTASSSWRRSLIAAVLGSAVAIGGILALRVKLAMPLAKRAGAASRAPLSPHLMPAPRALAAPGADPATSARAVDTESEIAPERAAAHAPPGEASAATSLEARPRRVSKVKSVRVRARWAPVRAEGEPAAKVLCSLPRGALMAVFAERPGTHARWFEVRCAADTPGWVHENFLARVRE